MSDDEWMVEGTCTTTDPEMFFSQQAPEIRAAVKICSECPVRVLCANYAINTNQEYGVWGGLTEVDRKQLRGKRSQSRAGISNKNK